MNRRFSNPHIKNIRRGALHFLKWFLGHYDDPADLPLIPEDFKYPFPKAKLKPAEPKVLWVNHSTFLIEIDGIRILTDPIWSDRCSPFSFIGPKRKHKPGIDLDKLPHIDFVLISHNHYDHLDSYTVKKIHQKFPQITWFVPLGLRNWFHKRKIYKVKEMRWWEETLFHHPHSKGKFWITGVPAQHHSGRGLFDSNKSLWMGFVIKTKRENGVNKSLYFVGDTAYNEFDFKKIGERFSKIDLCLCPIGTYRPTEFMKTVHSNPEDAVKIHIDVKSSLSIGMHWKTFKLSDEDLNRPPYDLYLALKKFNKNVKTFLPLEPGVEINW